MAELTTAADLAWRIAALEARRSRASAIEVDHLLVGLLSLEKLADPAAGLDPTQRGAARREHDALARVLADCRLDPATLRREVRRGIPAGTAEADGVLHRSSDCRGVFERADVLAEQHGSPRCGVLHLLAALLERPSAALSTAVPGQATGTHPGLAALRRRIEIALTPTRPLHQPVPKPPAPRELGGGSSPGPDPGPGPGSGPAAGAEPGPHQPHGARTVPSPFPGPVPGPVPAPFPGPDSGPLTGPLADPPLLPGPLPPTVTPPSALPPVLARYGRDLTAEAAAGRLPPVIGRRAEMLQVVRVLHRRTKNSPVLIGEAGVGKTAIVEGLARRIVAGTALPGRRIVALSLASVVAGASFRGQFEERLEAILAALRERPDVILFLDELHTLVGAGNADGRLDAANILKPALARGEITCIGATTTDEYREHIESDPALERRFQPVMVAEPSPAEARAMLEGLRSDLERHHDAHIDAEALDAAVELTVRYVTGRRLPDKAVDALDEACARARVPTLTQRPGQADEVGARRAVVRRETVAEVVATWTGIPLGQIGQAEAARLADLESRLAGRVVGQEAAIRQVAGRVRMARTGLTDPGRPAGVLLFVGPSGVGKTELARALAEVVADGSERLIRLDMSEYGEKHAVARLVGAPPGYVGHDKEGQLTGPLHRSPHAVVLLDEVEKAHPEVFDLFLQVFDAGRLTDASGRTVDARHAVFILTSNLLPSGPARRGLGFGQGAAPASMDVQAELRRFFRPELLNRIDEVVLFEPLGAAELTEIARRRLAELRRRVREQHEIDLTISDEALALLVEGAGAGAGGAREVARVIARLVEEPLSRQLLGGEVGRRDHVIAQVEDDGQLVLVRDTQTM